MTIGFPVPSKQGAQDFLSLIIHFVSACSAVRTSEQRIFVLQISTCNRLIGRATVLHAAVAIPNVMVRGEESSRPG